MGYPIYKPSSTSICNTQMSSSDDNTQTIQPINTQTEELIDHSTSETEDTSTDTSSGSSSSEEESKKKVINMIQSRHHADGFQDLRSRFLRLREKYMDYNYIYASKVDTWFKYDLKRPEIKKPDTIFYVITKNFRLIYSVIDNKVIYTDGKGTYLAHSELHLRRSVTTWLTPNVLLLSFVYAHKKHAAIEFQVVIERTSEYYHIRSTQVLIHYEELELPQLIPKTGYPSKIKNWYIFFQ